MNTFTLIRRQVLSRAFATLTAISLLLGAFPAQFAGAARTGVSLSEISGTTTEVNVNLPLKVALSDDDQGRPQAMVRLEDGNSGGSFTDGTLDGVCNGGTLNGNNPAGLQVSEGTKNKAFCYSNPTPGTYTITATLRDGEEDVDNPASIEVIVTEAVVDEKKVDICHWNGQDYIPQNVSVNSIGTDHGVEGVNQGDIIPPIEPAFPAGFNWDWGQPQWENKCMPPTPPPAPVPECEVVIKSDGTNTVVEKGGSSAKELSFIHNSWTEDLPYASWIWGDDPIVDPLVNETQTFVNRFGWAGDSITSATLKIASDNSFIATLNDTEVGSDPGEFNYSSLKTYDVTGFLELGNNELEVAVTNFALPNSNNQSNPGGLYYELTIVGVGEECEIPYEPEDPIDPVEDVYCGNGKVDQEWEQCDGGESCTPQCQDEQADQCTDLVLAQVSIDGYENNEGSNGNMTDDIYLGQGALPIPNGTWFPVYWNGTYVDDADVGGYEDVPGLAVERSAGKLRAVMHGSQSSADEEHVNGAISFWSWDGSVEAESVISDGGKNNKLEGTWTDGSGLEKTNAGDDEVWIDAGDAGFWLTTTVADDGFYTEYSDPVVCDIQPVCDPEVNLIANGGFELPSLSRGSWNVFYTGHAGLAWLTGDNGVEIQNYKAGTPYAGSQLAELDPHHPTMIWQEIPTIPGKTYRFSTQYSPRPGRALEDNRFEFLLNDSPLGASIARDGSTNSDTVWSYEEREFVATGETTTVGFREIGTDTSYGAYLDEVSLNCIPEPTKPETSDVTMCKVDDQQNPLTGWTLVLKDEKVGDFVVPVDNAAGVETSGLKAGKSYVALAQGTWDNNRTPLNVVDAEYSTEDNWVTHMDGFNGSGTDILELAIEGVAGDWGAYNGDHLYAQSFVPAVDGPVTLSILDSYYGDNTGSLNVAIYEGYAGETSGEAGCVTFEDVPYGGYTADEILLDGWKNVEGLGSVTVDDAVEKFTVVNSDDIIPPPTTYRIDGYKYEVDGESTVVRSGWTIDLYEENEKIAATTTDANGYYYFDVEAGIYEVHEGTATDWEQHHVTQDGDTVDTDAEVEHCSFNVPDESNYDCDFYNERVVPSTPETPTDSDRPQKGSTGTRLPKPAPTPLVAGAATSAYCPFIKDYMQMGADNDPVEVKKLQLFLHIFRSLYGGTENPITGHFGAITDANVKKFQEHYRSEVLDPWYLRGIVPHYQPTGFVYKTTLWKINSIICPDYAVWPTFTGESLSSNVALDATPEAD